MSERTGTKTFCGQAKDMGGGGALARGGWAGRTWPIFERPEPLRMVARDIVVAAEAKWGRFYIAAMETKPSEARRISLLTN
jgi:hypothetical protein